MNPRTPSPKRSKLAPARAGSWLALLAATTLGDAAETVHAEVRADGLADAGSYRLVVQSFDERPNARSKPLGSTQRAVTAEELRKGVHVSLLELREAGSLGNQDPTVVAWVEAGEPDLEFDGRRARPQPGSVYGLAKRDADGAVHISLSRKRGV